MKKRMLVIVFCLLIAASVPILSFAASGEKAAAAETSSPETAGLNVICRSPEAIKTFASRHPASLDQPVTYKTEPSLSGTYSAGILSDETQQSALNLINQIRYIAGLDGDVTIAESYSELASASTLINCLNGSQSHYPKRPNQLADSQYNTLYSEGYIGSTESNLGTGTVIKTLNQAVLDGWMHDSDTRNISCVGHRRWLLNPATGSTGFGVTQKSSVYYHAMYAHDRGAAGGQTGVAWPAQNMPVQYFRPVGVTDKKLPAWSVSFGKELDADSIRVTLVRVSDHTTWTFSNTSSSGDFYVDNQRYGQTGCVIFRPDTLTSVSAGDIFHVTISGVENTDISYQVSFFDLNESVSSPSASGTCGTDITWNYSGGLLKLSGTGNMYNYKSAADVPWAEYTGTITNIEISAGITGIGDFAFAGCDNLTEACLPSKITVVGKSAFERCTYLEKITLPDNLTTISDAAFKNCTLLQNFQLPEKLRFIGGEAFAHCRYLQEIRIPSSVASIGTQAFAYCSRLKKAFIYAKMPEISGCHIFLNSSVCVFYCYKNSYMAAYLENLGYDYQYLDDMETLKTIEAESESYNGAYDGQKHYITVSVKNLPKGSYRIYYSLSELTGIYSLPDYPSESCPGVSESGTTKIYYYICSDGYAIYAGSTEIVIGPKPVALSECTITLSSTAFYYDGTMKKPTVTVKDGFTTLTEGTDYKVKYSNNINAGTAVLQVTGTGNYTGTVSRSFTIVKSSQSLSVSIPRAFVSMGKTLQISAEGTKENAKLRYQSDNTRIASVNSSGLITGVAPGQARITVTAMETANYKELSKTLNITVAKADISSFKMFLSQTDFTYDGKAKKPAVTLKYGSVTLKKGTDYTVEYYNNVDSGKAIAVATGIGKYTGGISRNFTIAKAPQTITVSISAKSIAVGKTAQITAQVTKGRGALSYTSNRPDVATVDPSGLIIGKAVGTAVITITAAPSGNYRSTSKTLTVTVVPKSPSVSALSNSASGITIKWSKVTGAGGYYVYRRKGSETGWTRMKTITSGSTISWTDTKATANGMKYTYVAKAYKTVSGTTYTSAAGSSKTTYRLSRPSISGLTSSTSKTFKVTWSKNTKASGYQVQYAASSSFSGAKTKTYSGYNSVTKSISGLTKGRTYYVRVRAYKTAGNTKYYSAWSTVKKIKVRY